MPKKELKKKVVRQFTKRFEAARDRKGLSNMAVAELSGVGKTTVYRAIDFNGAGLSLENLEALCLAVGIHPREVWEC